MTPDNAVSLESRLRRLVPWMALVTVVLWIPLVLPAEHSWDDADPEVLNNAWRLARGQPLYHALDGPPWVVSPYTPLYHALVAAMLRLTGLSYRPARLLCLAASLTVAAALVVLARRWRGDGRQGAWAACVLLLVPAVLYNVARPHPQMLAVALSVWSFVLFDHPRRWVAGLLSPLLAVLAVYTKQTQIVLPAALGVWLAWRDRRRLAGYAGVVALLGLLPASALQAATHGAFMETIFGLNLLPYRLSRLPSVFLGQAGPFLPFLGLAAVRLALRVRVNALEPVDFYWAGLVVTSVPSLGRVGAHSQYVLEMLVVTVLYLLRTGGLDFPARLRWLAAAQLAGLMLYAPSFVLFDEGPFDRSSIAAAPEMRALLRTVPGPVISQQGSFSLFTRNEIHVQLFHFAGLARTGRWDQRPLVSEIEDHGPSWVVTESPLEEPMTDDDDWERFTPEVRAALARNYVRRAQIGPYYVYRPR